MPTDIATFDRADQGDTNTEMAEDGFRGGYLDPESNHVIWE